MNALQLQLLIAVAHTVRDMASNPLASVDTARLSEALAAVEERYGEPCMNARIVQSGRTGKWVVVLAEGRGVLTNHAAEASLGAGWETILRPDSLGEVRDMLGSLRSMVLEFEERDSAAGAASLVAGAR